MKTGEGTSEGPSPDQTSELEHLKHQLQEVRKNANLTALLASAALEEQMFFSELVRRTTNSKLFGPERPEEGQVPDIRGFSPKTVMQALDIELKANQAAMSWWREHKYEGPDGAEREQWMAQVAVPFETQAYKDLVEKWVAVGIPQHRAEDAAAKVFPERR